MGVRFFRWASFGFRFRASRPLAWLAALTVALSASARAQSRPASAAGKREEPAAPAGGLTASELLWRGRAAFDGRDFAGAEKYFDQLLEDYGENPEVAPLADEIRPALALCRIRRGAFDEALVLIDRSLKAPKLPAAALDELRFWRGVCLLRLDRTREAQEQFGAYFAEEAHDRYRRYEAFLLFGAGYVELGDFRSAADFFKDRIPKLPPDQKEVAGRARVLLLHSLIEAGRRDEALALARETFPLLEEMTQVVSFQLLTLRLGSELLEAGKWHDAIACLNRLWPRGRLLEHQRRRREEWTARRERLKKEGAAREALVFQMDGVLTRLARELEQFEKIESYDAALQLRLARAFMGLERWREAATLLERAVTTLPEDETLARAALTELQCWRQIPRWDKALAAADRCLRRFFPNGSDPEVPGILLARGEALRGLSKLEEAERQFAEIARRFPKDAQAARALFLAGICQMEMERFEAAAGTFRMVAERFPESPLRADALYWEGVTLTFQKAWNPAREKLAEYLKEYPRGPNAGDAAFERARCLHNQLRHAPAAAEFQAFLKQYPDHRRAGEAWLLLGEALMAEGRVEDGMKALEKVPEDNPRLHEEAQFKIGEALRKLDRPEDERRHFAAWMAAHPRSRRLAEAVLWQGRAARKTGNVEEARALYWRTLESLGDDPANEGVEDLLLATRRLYPGAEGGESLLARLDGLHRSAREAGRKTLAARALWARGHLSRETSPDEARAAFLQLGELLDPAVHHPRMLADCADARREAGALKAAAELYRALRKWHPRAVERERSSYGLGMIALAEGRREEAMEWFKQCEKEAVAGSAGGDAMLERAALSREAGKIGEAEETLRKVAGGRLTLPRQKARALLELGRCALDRGDPAKAATHFQRCYLSGARFPEFAGEAWIQHGLCLEALKRTDEAVKVYQALLAKRGFKTLPVAGRARERLAALGGSVATPVSTTTSVP